MMVIREFVAKRIVELCDQRNLSFGRLATQAGLNSSTVKSIVNGDSKNPGMVTVKKICDGFGMTMIEFLDTAEFYSLELENKEE